jgi:hypothetical protein
MDGLSNAEIARKMGCIIHAVERRIERILLIWEDIGALPQERAPTGSTSDRIGLALFAPTIDKVFSFSRLHISSSWAGFKDTG